MSGRFDIQNYGQLAVMDAIVFFVGAVLVSSVLMSYVATSPRQSQESCAGGDSDPAELLRTFLATSLCQTVLIEIDQQFVIDDRTTAAESLAIELRALEVGHDILKFEHLNSIIHDILKAVSNPAFEPYLLVVDLDDDLSGPVLSIPGKPDVTENAYASSAEIPGSGATVYLVQLILCPALLPELV